LATIGLVGNLLSYLLMNQSKYSKSTTCFYMRCLAIFDSAYIIGRMVLRYLLVVASDILLQPVAKTYFCLFYLAFLHFTLILSPLILTTMAFDRFVALTWPLKAAALCTMRRSKQVTFAIVSTGVVIGCAQLLRSERPLLRSWYCPYHFKVGRIISDKITSAIYIYLPMICLVICNIGIICALKNSNKDFSRISKTRRSSSKERSITKTTIMVTCLFIISCIPFQLEELWHRLNYNRSPQEILHIKIVTINFAILMENLNYCLNFYMYGLSCKRFRKELVMILSCRYKTLERLATQSEVLS
jgi:hypothetical protein